MTGRRVWWYFVMFFGFIAMINTVMITLAMRTHSGLVTDHAYEKGLAYNQVVKAEEQQEQLGWKGDIRYAGGQLDFALKDKSGATIKPDKATATLTRPTKAGMDFTVELAGAKTAIAFPTNGTWEIRIDAYYQGTHYQQSKRIIVE